VRAWSQPTEGGRAVAVADLTGDGLPDLYVTTWSRDNLLPNPPDLLFVNHRNLRFTLAAIPEALTGQGASASVVPYGSSEALLVSNGPNGWVGPLQLIVATDSD